MKAKYFIAIITTVIMFSCGNGNSSDENNDSANALTDTLPATSLVDSIAIDSNPADGTNVDSLKR